MTRTLEQALEQNFRDGTLARAVGIIASTIVDPVECSTLEEAATRLGQVPPLLVRIAALEEETGALRITLWNRMRGDGVAQDTAIATIRKLVADAHARAALALNKETPDADG